MKKIFITGGTGFIGRHFVKKLAAADFRILLLARNPQKDYFLDLKNIDWVKGDLSRPGRWLKKVKNFKPDAAVHLAWEGIPNFGARTSVRNLINSFNLVKELYESGCPRVLAVGSCWEYEKKAGKLNEKAVLQSRSDNAFVASKIAFSALGSILAREMGKQFVWARLFFVYGPGQKKFSLIPYILETLEKGEKPRIKNWRQKNDFIYAADAAEALILILEKMEKMGPTEVFNIGSGELTSVKEIVKTIYCLKGFNNFLKDIPKKPDLKSTNFFADISKIKKLTGWRPKTSIQEGIRLMIKENESR